MAPHHDEKTVRCLLSKNCRRANNERSFHNFYFFNSLLVVRIYKFLSTVFNIHRDRKIFDNDPRLLQRSVSAFQKIVPLALKHSDRFYSQFGQDILVAEVLFMGDHGYFLDVGARCGIINSNSYALEKSYGWKGMLIEPERESYQNILSERVQPALNLAISDYCGTSEFVSFKDEPGHSTLFKLMCHEELSKRAHQIYMVKVSTIREILHESQIKTVDYLDIDVEDEELAVIRGIDFSATRFRVIAVESNTARYHDIRLLMAERGYVPLCKLGVDVFYVRDSEFERYCDCIESES